MNDARVVHEFELRDSVIRASVGTFRQKVYLDLRTFWEPESGGGWKPTKKGITVPLECLEDLEAAIAALRRATDGIERRDDAA